MIEKTYAATSVGLITAPWWSEALHVYTGIMTAASMTMGFAVGCITVAHWIRTRNKEKKK